MKPLFIAAAALAARPCVAAEAPGAGIVTITAARGGTLPADIPATVETISREQIAERINATDAEDALKYFPSLLVRKRYPGDYNHAVLSTRASGTGNSARSAVYADGILLSNWLGNGAAFTPRWGLVTPEEIERVDVLYGPFSAAYPGNSAGAVVDYVTRMPQRFEAHAQAGGFAQRFRLYGSDDTYRGRQASASLGSRDGAFAWWVNVNHLDSESQPLTFATKFVSAAAGSTGTPVQGAVAGLDKSGLPWWIVGSGSQVSTQQDHAKAKFALDLGRIWEGVRAQLVLAGWFNRASGQSQSWLRRADGSVFATGTASIDGRDYAITGADLPANRDRATHAMQGLTVQRKRGETFDWQLAASRYDYASDTSRSRTPARITDLSGTGWYTLAARGTWRPAGAHSVEGGVQFERYAWRQKIDDTADWIAGPPSTPSSAFSGDTQLASAFVQDTWALAPAWKAVLGLRHEQWRAFDGSKRTGSAAPVPFAGRSGQWLSPKAAIGWQATDALSLRLATGRAVRVPTVGELFQGSASNDPVNNPGLAPEKSQTTEFTAQWQGEHHRLRGTVFHERSTDALYTQAIPGTLLQSVQNIDRIRTWGFEQALELAVARALDLQASVTYADSVIAANRSDAGTVGKQQPRVPRWRASVLAAWRVNDALSATFGARYGSRQYGTLNNSDFNGNAYQGFSPYLVSDLRLRWKIAPLWSAAVGIDNLANRTYWNFHPYPQRTFSAELRFDL